MSGITKVINSALTIIALAVAVENSTASDYGQYNPNILTNGVEMTAGMHNGLSQFDSDFRQRMQMQLDFVKSFDEFCKEEGIDCSVNFLTIDQHQCVESSGEQHNEKLVTGSIQITSEKELPTELKAKIQQMYGISSDKIVSDYPLNSMKYEENEPNWFNRLSIPSFSEYRKSFEQLGVETYVDGCDKLSEKFMLLYSSSNPSQQVDSDSRSKHMISIASQSTRLDGYQVIRDPEQELPQGLEDEMNANDKLLSEAGYDRWSYGNRPVAGYGYKDNGERTVTIAGTQALNIGDSNVDQSSAVSLDQQNTDVESKGKESQTKPIPLSMNQKNMELSKSVTLNTEPTPDTFTP